MKSDCIDAGNEVKDAAGYTCEAYNLFIEAGVLDICGQYDNEDFTATIMCCKCKDTGRFMKQKSV